MDEDALYDRAFDSGSGFDTVALPDGRTQLIWVTSFHAADLHEMQPHRRPRVFDTVTRTLLLDLWPRCADVEARWSDEGLVLTCSRPGYRDDARVGYLVDLAGRRFRDAGDEGGAWQPLAALQAEIDRQIPSWHDVQRSLGRGRSGAGHRAGLVRWVVVAGGLALAVAATWYFGWSGA